MRTLIPDLHLATAPAAPSRTRRCIPDAVLAQARMHPDRAAVVCGTETLSYHELAYRAAVLAAQLHEAGVRRESVVAICLPRTSDLVTSVLGIWLAGGACVLIDPATPQLRQEHILNDSGAIAVVTDTARAPDSEERAVLVPQPVPGASAAGVDTLKPVLDVTQEDLAYLVYTSGTTGMPKGVLVDHGNLARSAAAHEDVLHSWPGRPVQRVALNSGLGSDVLFSEIVNLAFGRTLVVLEEDTRRDPERLTRSITDRGIQVLDSTPTQIRTVLLAGCVNVLASLEILILGGEAVDEKLWQQLRALPHLRVYNFYGPSECTIDVTVAELARHPHPVIGTELPGNRILILDDHQAPVPDGQVGEICVTGTSLARGYTRPDPASMRFAHLAVPGEPSPVRVYRTGDLGRRNAAGALEFHGRADNQVSVNGYRVELGEIEAALRTHPDVHDVAVGAQGHSGQTQLTAWLVLAGHADFHQIQEHLAQRVPRHMLPHLEAVTAIPLGPTGKADITALQRTAARPTSQADSLADVVHTIWRETLGVTEVQPGDDFFALGGDSVQATQMIVATRSKLARAIPIRTVFDHSRFADFCTQLTTAAGPR